MFEPLHLCQRRCRFERDAAKRRQRVRQSFHGRPRRAARQSARTRDETGPLGSNAHMSPWQNATSAIEWRHDGRLALAELVRWTDYEIE